MDGYYAYVLGPDGHVNIRVDLAFTQTALSFASENSMPTAILNPAMSRNSALNS